MTGHAGDTLTYDAENRLTQVVTAGGVKTTVYTYNGDGERVKQSVTASGTTTTTYPRGTYSAMRATIMNTPCPLPRRTSITTLGPSPEIGISDVSRSRRVG